MLEQSTQEGTDPRTRNIKQREPLSRSSTKVSEKESIQIKSNKPQEAVIVKSHDRNIFEWIPFSPNPWFMSIPRRVWFSFKILALPFQILGFILDVLVSSAIVGLLVVIWMWWTKAISDDQVADVIGQIGSRGLAILMKSGVMQ